MKTYKTECSKCRKTYDTDIKYYNYICPQCEEAQKKAQQKFDEDLLEKARLELEQAIADGKPQSEIDALTLMYNTWYHHVIEKYGTSTRSGT